MLSRRPTHSSPRSHLQNDAMIPYINAHRELHLRDDRSVQLTTPHVDVRIRKDVDDRD